MINIIYVKQIVDSLMEYIYQDINSTGPRENTFLYKLLYGIKDGNFDFYDQAQKIYSRNPNYPNNIRVVLEYPKDRTSLPCYVIREPGKDRGPVGNIGKIESFNGYDGTPQYLDSRESNFEIMCFTDNMLESILMSEVLYALLISAHDMMTDKFDTIDYGMKELMTQNDLAPTPLFIKSIRLDVSSSEIIPSLVDNDLLGKIIFQKAEISAMEFTDNVHRNGLPGAESEII